MASYPDLFHVLETARDHERRMLACHRARWHEGGCCYEPYAGTYGCSGVSIIQAWNALEERMWEVA